MFPLVSVIMSTYNRASIVRESVESILNQTMQDFEFIIVNDNSQDDTQEIIERYNDKRIILLNNRQRCGCTFNYHIANNLAKGKYIAHIDDDDISLKNRLEKQISFMDNNKNIALCGTFIETFGETKKPSFVLYTNHKKLDFVMNFYNPICHSSIIYRKNFINKNAINYDFKKECSQDYDLYKQIIMKGGELANIPEILVKYRMHSDRITENKTTQEIQIQNANIVKRELLSRFFTTDKINEIFDLTKGFPFNEYNIEKVMMAIDMITYEYLNKDSDYKEISDEIKNDITSNLYKF